MKKLIALVMVLMLTGITAAQARGITLTPSDIQARADQVVNASYTRGYCLEWLATQFWQPLGAPYASDCCAYAFGSSNMTSSSRSDIPVGANVFFSGSNVVCGNGHQAGHVGVYIGNGQILSLVHYNSDPDNLSYVRKNTIGEWESWGYSYRGWGYPVGVNLSENQSSYSTIAYVSMNCKIIKASNLKSEPYQNSSNVGSVVPGDTIQVVEVIQNKYNNIWLKTSNNGFIYAGYRAKDGVGMVKSQSDMIQDGDQYVAY